MMELSIIGLVTAFAAGVISFLSPCVLPLVPGYVSFVAGSSLEDLRDGAASRLQALSLSATFVLGFTAVFVALGASATALGHVLLSWRYELGLVAGVVVILFGLHMLGLTPFALMDREARFHVEMGGGRALSAFVLGIAFAFGWTPCIGPVLGAILTLGASTAPSENPQGRCIAQMTTAAAPALPRTPPASAAVVPSPRYSIRKIRKTSIRLAPSTLRTTDS